MINSMTGFGVSQGRLDGVDYAVEIKTVNNRYFKTRIKLPDIAGSLEENIEKLLRENLLRGMVDYVLGVKNVSTDVLFDIDEKAISAYMEKLNRLGSSAGIECGIDMVGLLGLPGIIQPVLPDEKKTKQIKQMVLSVTEEELKNLKEMRCVEGAALAADLEGQCKAIKESLEQICARSESILPEYAAKLKKRVDVLLSNADIELDQEVLAREMAILADKSDISEEITRLDSHLQQFMQSCQVSGQVGRRLDFISQEMLREANTIASKAFDTEIIHRVVDMKCWIDRIKEQVQNIV